MQVYKHPDHENVIILSVKTSPIIQQLITSWDHAAESQYDTQQEWYSMSHDTYQKLRRHLMNSATLTPPRVKRSPPVPEVAALSPPSKRYRSLQTQTDPQASTEERHAQTETETEEQERVVPASVRESPPSTIVLPLPIQMAEELVTPSPSQLVQPQIPTVLEEIPQNAAFQMDATMRHAPASSAGRTEMNSIQDIFCHVKKISCPHSVRSSELEGPV